MRRTSLGLAIVLTLAAALLASPHRSRAAPGDDPYFPDRLQGTIPRDGGIAATVWGGGTVHELSEAAGFHGCATDSAWIFVGGAPLGYVYGAPSFVNAGFAAAVPEEVPAGTIVLLRCTPIVPPVPTTTLCGAERWAVKTLSDPDAGAVDFTPVDTTVDALRALSPPAALHDNARAAPTELTTYRVTANVVAFRLQGDRDIQLTIADPGTGATMIVEFPDAETCVGAMTSARSSEMRAARASIIAAFGTPPTSSDASIMGTVTLTGVGFFDAEHDQSGAAPNGIQLHPVLSFAVDGATAAVAGR